MLFITKRRATLCIVDIQRIITAIQIETNIRITAENTLIIIDEIQEAERAITSLKYFMENAPQYHVIAAGSQLGVTMHKNTSFPVGKVDFLNMHPWKLCQGSGCYGNLFHLKWQRKTKSSFMGW
jgi:predicted AAA+ superfamily ATPase